jgi:hypothetical protein
LGRQQNTKSIRGGGVNSRRRSCGDEQISADHRPLLTVQVVIGFQFCAQLSVDMLWRKRSNHFERDSHVRSLTRSVESDDHLFDRSITPGSPLLAFSFNSLNARRFASSVMLFPVINTSPPYSILL